MFDEEVALEEDVVACIMRLEAENHSTHCSRWRRDESTYDKYEVLNK